MQADTVKTAIKKLTDTLGKQMHNFQCQQLEFKCKKVPNISDQNKQRNYRYITLVHARHYSQNCVILYDNPTIKNLTTIMLLLSCRSIISHRTKSFVKFILNII